MSTRRARIHGAACVLLACFAIVGRARALEPSDGSVLFQVIGSDLLGPSREDWDFGPGFGLTTQWRVQGNWDIRGDVGARWYEGSHRADEPRSPEPDWGRKIGEETDGLQLIPVNVGVVYRFERWSKGRFWVPYTSMGCGFYDFEARFLSGEAERVHRLFRLGWHGRAGVRLERTSGVFVTMESTLHAVDVPGRWTALYDIALGVGASLPPR